MRLDLDKFNASVITEDVGKGFIFADIYKSYVSIRTNSSMMDEVPVLAESSETEEEKVKYTLTDEDKQLGVDFNKAVLLKVIADRFFTRYKDLMVDASDLEKDTWEEQKREAFAYQENSNYSTPVIDILSSGRGIDKQVLVDKIISNVTTYNTKLATLLLEQQLLETKVKNCNTIADCHRVRHEKFGVGMSRQQKIDEEIETTPLTLKIDF
jgi:adenylate kinase family enzyme